MCSPTGFVFILIVLVATVFNCLHFAVCVVVARGDGSDGSDGSVAAAAVQLRRIDVTRKRSVHLNGVEIDENSLLNHLEDHERELIFGKNIANRNVRLVHLRHRTDADEAASSAAQSAPRRVKRADTAGSNSNASGSHSRQSGAPTPLQEVALHIQDNEHLLHLKLRETPKLIDDAFIYIRRYANSTQFIEDSHKLAEKYERCFYSNENAALDLCDDVNVRGVYQHNATDFIIQPLPARFGNSTHVILEADHQLHTSAHTDSNARTAASAMDANIQFEPDEMEFNELSILSLGNADVDVEETSRPTRNINSTNDDSQSLSAASKKQHLHQQQQQLHHHRNKNNSRSRHQSMPWHLPYKPRFQYNEHHSQQHRKQHKERKQHTHHQQQQQQQQQHQHKQHKNNNKHKRTEHSKRQRRHIPSASSQWQVLTIETAIFVDSDLLKHMSKNFPKDTESHLMRFVLAMINGVQLLYHHHSLGRRVNFVLKRLEILYKDLPDLQRSSDIDTYLSNFCTWQRRLNPEGDENPMHFDHAVILTGLDLYVVGKNGKVISQVVGLAPVAGMCTKTSSCTINEGKHFESVFVVAHEIGHNLGMRHDTKDIGCDPSLHIMSPTLGSGKITWSKCSRTYLNDFLKTPMASCLFDSGQFISNLDHSAEGLLPGERFDANQQCMLKYGKDSVRATTQESSDVCRDLHCKRDRYTWTSHPALEGTICGDSMWCRSGVCVMRPALVESYNSPRQLLSASKSGYDKASFVETSKMGHLRQEYNYNKPPSWGEWSEASECDSSCLYGPSKRLREGSTGLKTYTRSCLDSRRRCLGRDRKFESCVAQQCYRIAIITIETFATQVCEKAQKFDAELTGAGAQIVGDIEESCKVFCKTKANGTKSRNWIFPDGTTCRTKLYDFDDTAYCIAGRCEKFSCDNATSNYHKIDPIFCQYRQRQPPPQSAETEAEDRHANSYNNIPTHVRYADRDNSYNRYNNRNGNGLNTPTTPRSKYENEVAIRSFHGQTMDQTYRRKADYYATWNKNNYDANEAQQAPPPVSASLVSLSAAESEWTVKSGCHSSCMAKSKGIQVVTNRRTGANNIQLCTHAVKPCERLLTPTEYAENTCVRYKLKVRGLSGLGTQIAASIDEPDRSCRVGCQDEFIKYRYYLVNGKYGHFPLGTKCSHTEERYCVNGKCLEFGEDKIPLQQSHISLALFRNRRSIAQANASQNVTSSAVASRQKRSFLYYDPVNITETITQDFLNSIVNSIMEFEKKHFKDEHISSDHIEFTNPIHFSTDELSTN